MDFDITSRSSIIKSEEKNEDDVETEDLDLPLSSNYNDIYVHHYNFDLACDMSRRVFKGEVSYFIEGQVSGQHALSFACLILDSFALKITDCWTYDLCEEEKAILKSTFTAARQCPLKMNATHLDGYANLLGRCQNWKQKIKLPFLVEKHSIKIEMPDWRDYNDMQALVIIQYTTQADGPSLMWTNDQDGRPCVFTIGDMLSNRSLFPSQDTPKSMSTWHCKISLPLSPESPEDMIVLMTGENECIIDLSEIHGRSFQSFSSLKMPMNTFALAIGCWSQSDVCSSTQSQVSQESAFQFPKCRFFFPASLTEKVSDLFGRYVPGCFKALSELFGSFPLNRMDVLIVPQCFDSLGLASPYLIFVSQSLLCDDLSMMHRLAHEVCHTWFGVLTGPSDWTEEWLTEGVCCYLEDVIHAKAMQWTEQEANERSDLRLRYKYKLLTAEIDVDPDALQVLRPEKGQEKNFVRNGLNSEKSFMQVHYLKGFFLLKHLETIADKHEFLNSLKEFVTQHLGQLYSSDEFLNFIFTHCPRLKTSDLTVSKVCAEWLDSPGLAQELNSCPTNLKSNTMYQQVNCQFEHLKKSTGRKRSSHGLVKAHTAGQFVPEQTLLLLDLLLEEGQAKPGRYSRVPLSFMNSLWNSFVQGTGNAEVLHAWCELIIQHRAAKWFPHLEDFLLQHRAMGLYLYGEMMITLDPRLTRLARLCYSKCRDSMPRNVLKELTGMLRIKE